MPKSAFQVLCAQAVWLYLAVHLTTPDVLAHQPGLRTQDPVYCSRLPLAVPGLCLKSSCKAAVEPFSKDGTSIGDSLAEETVSDTQGYQTAQHFVFQKLRRKVPHTCWNAVTNHPLLQFISILASSVLENMNTGLDVQAIGFNFKIFLSILNILSHLKLLGYKTRQYP